MTGLVCANLPTSTLTHSMYSTQPNGADSGTINPAALNSADLLNTTSRGIKRSRSPDNYQEPARGSDGASNPRKRGKQMKSRGSEPAGQAPAAGLPQGIQPPHTPHNPNAPLPGQAVAYAPTQASPPPKTTPTKTTLKALPTVRDHTTDQLNPSGDEYLPREIDEFGEKKVMANGQLLGGRTYRCRTFLVPNRGDRLFMLATECARVLGYRDSYLLFNKNRSLFKIIASQPEKDDLVAQEILPFSYRSRQIAIVTARSMFRQFGSRVIENGRRVRDDYWETKARKQGFTEADPAGEKRPGQAKAREAAEAQNQVMLGGPQGEIVYSNAPAQFPGAPQQPQIVQPGMLGPAGGSTRMPMISLGTDLSDTRPRDYSVNFKGGPRQEITGPPYQDLTRPAQPGEINQQAHHAAEYNRQVTQNRERSSNYLQDHWRRPHEQPQSASLHQQQPISTTEASVPTSRAAVQSPHTSSVNMSQPGLVPNQSPQMGLTNPPYSQAIHAQNPISQAPMRGMPQSSPQLNNRPTSLGSGATGSLSQSTPSYPYPGGSGQMWPQQMPQAHQHYPGYTTQGQQQQQQQQSHPQQSPAPQPQLRQHSSSGVQPGMQFSGMPGMSQGYGSNQAIYSAEQTPRQYMPQPNPGAPAVSQAWSNQQSPGAQWWANQPQ